MLQWLMLAETAADVTGPIVTGGVGTATIGALVWGVGKIIKMFEMMQVNEAKRTETVIESMQAMQDQIRIAESARTDAALLTIAHQVSLMNQLTEGQAAGIAQIIATHASARDVLHDLRNMLQDEAAKRYEGKLGSN